jgi:hypothetical protein
MEEIANAINQYGFPIIAAFGLGYFIYYIWTWVTEQVDPVVNESHMTLIGLIDRIRMLDNDLIRLRTKLDMILQEQEKDKNEAKAALDNSQENVLNEKDLKIKKDNH